MMSFRRVHRKDVRRERGMPTIRVMKMKYARMLFDGCVGFVVVAAFLTVTGCDKTPPQVQLLGRVLDLADNAPVEGAQVQAVDIAGTPVGDTAMTDAEGRFELTVPQMYDPDEGEQEGEAGEYGVYMLRCQAPGYQGFPDAVRPSLPIDMGLAVKAEFAGDTVFGKQVIDETVTTLTVIKLIALVGDVNLLGSISGHLVLSRDAAESTGALVAAVDESTGEAYTGFSGLNGEYVIFNVPAGVYRVEAYAQGMQFDPRSGITLGAGEDRTDVDFSESANPLNTVRGDIQIVNAPGGSVTSVILVLESTFDETAVRGVVPPGLRAGDVTGAFVIENVPDGRYVVLAAFENDGLVRDPDESIAGTDIVHIEVPGAGGANDITIPDSFKVTEALAVVAPGAEGPEAVASLTPAFVWADDSSEDGYELRVLDSFGNEVWHTEAAEVSGSADVSLLYAGPALEPGMFYQFRVVSFRDVQDARTYISATEDMKGVFYFEETQ